MMALKRWLLRGSFRSLWYFWAMNLGACLSNAKGPQDVYARTYVCFSVRCVCITRFYLPDCDLLRVEFQSFLANICLQFPVPTVNPCIGTTHSSWNWWNTLQETHQPCSGEPVNRWFTVMRLPWLCSTCSWCLVTVVTLVIPFAKILVDPCDHDIYTYMNLLKYKDIHTYTVSYTPVVYDPEWTGFSISGWTTWGLIDADPCYLQYLTITLDFWWMYPIGCWFKMCVS